MSTTAPVYDDGPVALYRGDCREVMASLPDNSVDAIVTDPPYELGFMGKGWDSSGIAYDPTVWSEAFRVLKLRGHAIVFGGTCTWHRVAVAVEDALNEMWGGETFDGSDWVADSHEALTIARVVDAALAAPAPVDEAKLAEVVDAAQRRWNGSGRHEPIADAITRDVLALLRGEGTP